MGWMMRVHFLVGAVLRFFLFATTSRQALGPPQPPVQWVPGAFTPQVKQLGCEGDHSPPSSAKVKNAWSFTSTLQYVFMVWCCIKHRDNFTSTLPDCINFLFISFSVACSTLECIYAFEHHLMSEMLTSLY
jgi:hypothetical protein